MIKLYSYGKINLFLDIEGKLPNGYHLIKSVMQSIDLHDEISIENWDKNEIIINCNDPNIPTNEKNTCYKAASIIKETYHKNEGVIIKIEKAIPSEAGLAGGSSNSAAVIHGLNKLWNLNMSTESMLEIGLKVGADVPFCILGGTYLAEGVGEKLTKVNDFVWSDILLIKPDFSMSTAFVYTNLGSDCYNSLKDNEILNYINLENYCSSALSVANTLEHVVEKFNPKLKDIKKLLVDSGAIISLMTGSGSAVFGLFPDSISLNEAYEKICPIYPKTFKTSTITKGVQIFD